MNPITEERLKQEVIDCLQRSEPRASVVGVSVEGQEDKNRYKVSILFSIEYILRLWTYRIDGEKPTIRQRISNITSFYMVIDLISIIPFYLSLFMPTGYGFIRIVRILRLFRLMKFGRYMKSQNLVVK